VSGGAVHAFAIERQAHQRLDARHVSLALDKIVFVVQRDFTVFHERASSISALADYWLNRAKLLA
jgi:hypothetical protein